MPLLSGVVGAGAEEKPSRVAVDFFSAAVWETYFCHRFQTQLGLQVNQLAAQLQQNTLQIRSGISFSHTGSQVYRLEIKKKLPSRISTEKCWWLDAARGMKIIPPVLQRCQNTNPRPDRTGFQIWSSAHSAAISQENSFTHRLHERWLPWSPGWFSRLPGCPSRCTEPCWWAHPAGSASGGGPHSWLCPHCTASEGKR